MVIRCCCQDGRMLDPTHPYWHVTNMPALKSIAARGVNFIRTYTNNPQCVPSRTSMFSGLYTHKVRGWNNGQGISYNPKSGLLDKACLEFYGEEQCEVWKSQQNASLVRTLDHQLENLGLNVTLVGKVDVGANILNRFPEAIDNGYHSGPDIGILSRGANIFKPTKPNPLDITDTNKPLGPFPVDTTIYKQCVDFLSSPSVHLQQPFFLYCSINIPHPPFFTSDPYLSQVNMSAFSGEVAVPPWPSEEEFHEYDRYMSVSKNVWGNFSDQNIELVRKVYFAMNAQADEMHSKILAALDAANLTENTYIVMVSDHGEMNMEARQVWKNSLREASERVPFLLAGPGIPQGMVVEELTSLVDVYPTLTQLAGGVVEQWMDGYSVLDLIHKHATPSQTDALLRHNLLPPQQASRPPFVLSMYMSNLGNTEAFMIRDASTPGKQHKLITFGTESFPWFNQSAYPPQLFELNSDPHELHNLAPLQPDVVHALNRSMQSLFPTSDIHLFAANENREIFETYIFHKNAKGNNDTLRRNMEAAYKGFDEQDWNQVQLWRNTKIPKANL